ncbi:MAG: M28 family peptidase [Candidatus Hodarchaeota archaeon]
MKLRIKTRTRVIIIGVIIWGSFILLSLSSISQVASITTRKEIESQNFKFNETYVYGLIDKQVEISPRYPGSEGIEKARHLIASELPLDKWSIVYQNFTKKWMNDENITCVNIICEPRERNSSRQAFLLLAHYDTRLWADADPDVQKRKNYVPGANDGASGVAVVLELGKIMLDYYKFTNFQLIFFDAEDQGNINGWDWLIGSRYYAQSQKFRNENLSFGILLDMVGAKNATFRREKYSDQYASELVTWIWDEAHDLNFQGYFLNSSGRRIIDDHVPLLEQGLPVIDIIDDFGIRYTPWHTTFDNMTYIDEQTLKAVGETLESALFKLINLKEELPNLSTVIFETPVLFYYPFNIILFWGFKRAQKRKRRDS